MTTVSTSNNVLVGYQARAIAGGGRIVLGSSDATVYLAGAGGGSSTVGATFVSTSSPPTATLTAAGITLGSTTVGPSAVATTTANVGSQLTVTGTLTAAAVTGTVTPTVNAYPFTVVDLTQYYDDSGLSAFYDLRGVIAGTGTYSLTGWVDNSNIVIPAPMASGTQITLILPRGILFLGIGPMTGTACIPKPLPYESAGTLVNYVPSTATTAMDTVYNNKGQYVLPPSSQSAVAIAQFENVSSLRTQLSLTLIPLAPSKGLDRYIAGGAPSNYPNTSVLTSYGVSFLSQYQQYLIKLVSANGYWFQL